MLALSEDAALDQVVDFAANFGSVEQKRDAIVISAEYFEYKRAIKYKTIELTEFVRVKSGVVYRSLELLDNIILQCQRAQAA